MRTQLVTIALLATALLSITPAQADPSVCAGSGSDAYTVGVFGAGTPVLVNQVKSGHNAIVDESLAFGTAGGIYVNVTASESTATSGFARADVADVSIQVPVFAIDIQATALRAESTGSSDGDTKLGELYLSGIPVNVAPAPNTVLVGGPVVTVVLNEHVGSLAVNLIHVRIDLGLDAVDIIVAHAAVGCEPECDVVDTVAGVLDPYATMPSFLDPCIPSCDGHALCVVPCQDPVFGCPPCDVQAPVLQCIPVPCDPADELRDCVPGPTPCQDPTDCTPVVPCLMLDLPDGYGEVCFDPPCSTVYARSVESGVRACGVPPCVDMFHAGDDVSVCTDGTCTHVNQSGSTPQPTDVDACAAAPDHCDEVTDLQSAAAFAGCVLNIVRQQL